MSQEQTLETGRVVKSSSAIKKSDSDFCEISVAKTSGELKFSDVLTKTINTDNIAIFYHPKAERVKSVFIKSLSKNNVQIKEDKHFSCNYRTALEVADKISKQNFSSVFYVIDNSTENIFSLHKKDKLFLAISTKFENMLKIVIINNNTAEINE
jgi:hypothetical protein